MWGRGATRRAFKRTSRSTLSGTENVHIKSKKKKPISPCIHSVNLLIRNRIRPSWVFMQKEISGNASTMELIGVVTRWGISV